MLRFFSNTLIARLIYALKISRSYSAWRLGIPQEITALHHAGRNTAGWSPHLEHCKSEILAFLNFHFNQHPQKKARLQILGSGALNDVPVKKILSLYPNLILELIDLAHPSEAQSLQKRFPERVRLQEADLTGTLGFIPPFNEKNDSSDVIRISLNLLSQLPLFPLKIQSRQLGRELTEAEERECASPLIESHLKFLQRSHAALLITDLEWITPDSQFDPLYGLAIPPPWIPASPPWTWAVHPHNQNNRVGSFKLLSVHGACVQS